MAGLLQVARRIVRTGRCDDRGLSSRLVMARSAIHPGEHLAEATGGTAAQLARDIGVSPDRVTGILHGTRGVTADTALRLGRCVGTSAAFWMNLQQLF